MRATGIIDQNLERSHDVYHLSVVCLVWQKRR